jgi:membrane-associated phospholipid phosphatase
MVNYAAKKSFLSIIQNENDRNRDNSIFAVRQMRGKYFFAAGIGLIVLAFLWLLMVPLVHPTLWANRLHKPELDIFFSWCSYLGEWPLISFSIGFAMLKQPRLGIWFGLCFLLELFIVQGLKFGLNEPRPIQELGKLLFEVPGSPIAAWRSFPSGHTAGAFTALGFFAIISKHRIVEIICSILAALVGFSRLYLGQHYLHDVAAGICIAMFIWLLFRFGHKRISSIKSLTW